MKSCFSFQIHIFKKKKKSICISLKLFFLLLLVFLWIRSYPRLKDIIFVKGLRNTNSLNQLSHALFEFKRPVRFSCVFASRQCLNDLTLIHHFFLSFRFEPQYLHVQNHTLLYLSSVLNSRSKGCLFLTIISRMRVQQCYFRIFKIARLFKN